MLIELFLGLEVLSIVCFAVAFFRKDVWFWAFSLAIIGILIFASFNIEQPAVVVSNQTSVGGTIVYNHVDYTFRTADSTYTGLNIGLFAIGILLFFNDLFDMFRKKKLGQRG